MTTTAADYVELLTLLDRAYPMTARAIAIDYRETLDITRRRLGKLVKGGYVDFCNDKNGEFYYFIAKLPVSINEIERMATHA